MLPIYLVDGTTSVLFLKIAIGPLMKEPKQLLILWPDKNITLSDGGKKGKLIDWNIHHSTNDANGQATIGWAPFYRTRKGIWHQLLAAKVYGYKEEAKRWKKREDTGRYRYFHLYMIWAEPPTDVEESNWFSSSTSSTDYKERGSSSTNFFVLYIHIQRLRQKNKKQQNKEEQKIADTKWEKRKKVTRFCSTSFVFLFPPFYCYTAGCIIDQQAPTPSSL